MTNNTSSHSTNLYIIPDRDFEIDPSLSTFKNMFDPTSLEMLDSEIKVAED